MFWSCSGRNFFPGTEQNKNRNMFYVLFQNMVRTEHADHCHWENERAPGAFEIGRNGVEGFVVTASRDGWVSVWK